MESSASNEPASGASKGISLTTVRDLGLALGVLLSAGLWLAYLVFYSELGLSPSDVGIGFGQVLERSIGALVYIVLVSFVFAVAGGYVALAFRVVFRGLRPSPGAKGRALVRLGRRDSVAEQPGDRLWLIGSRVTKGIVAAIFTIGFAPLAVLALIDSDYLFFVSILAVGGSLVWGVLTGDSTEWDVAIVDLQRVLVRVALLTAVVSVAVFGLYFAGAKHAAEAVKDGETVDADNLFGIPTTAFTAWPSRLVSPGLDPDRCVLYLGSSDGVTFVYDHQRDLVERIPSGDLRVIIDRNAVGCL